MPASNPHDGPGQPLVETVWIEPYPDTGLEYEQRESVELAFIAALQHLLAIIVPIVTPGLLICQAIGVSPRDTNIIVSMSLVISGIASIERGVTTR